MITCYVYKFWAIVKILHITTKEEAKQQQQAVIKLFLDIKKKKKKNDVAVMIDISLCN